VKGVEEEEEKMKRREDVIGMGGVIF